MRAVVQRVTSASVSVEGNVVREIGAGLCILLGISRDDTAKDAEYVVKKILGARMFEEPATGKRWAKSVVDMDRQVLCLSQVTLYHKFKGNKLDFHTAMGPEQSKKLFESFVQMMKEQYRDDRIESGIFGAYCNIGINNDGPVTIVIESPAPQMSLETDTPSVKTATS